MCIISNVNLAAVGGIAIAVGKWGATGDSTGPGIATCHAVWAKRTEFPAATAIAWINQVIDFAAVEGIAIAVREWKLTLKSTISG